MNNSKIAFDSVPREEDKKQFLEKELGKLSQIVEAINGVEASGDWQKLKKMVLNGVVETLERQLLHETNKPKVELAEIYKLQGQLAWARKFTDLGQLSVWYKHQIENIKNQLHENPRDGAL